MILKISKIIKTAVLLLPYLLLAVYFFDSSVYDIFYGTRIETVTDMQLQNKYTPQKASTFFEDSAGFRTLPEHSIPANRIHYRFKAVEYDSAIARYKNPLPDDDYVIARGKNRFEIFCVPCHGTDGKGEGLIVTKPELEEDEEGFPLPSDLTSEYAKNLPDARVFHILSAGQNLMFPVNFKMNEIDRWAVIKYIRKLQYDD